MPGRKPPKESLLIAAIRGDLAEVERLLDAGADVGVGDEDGNTPLHWACRWGRIHIATLLLDRGADVNAQDIDSRTPLHWACINGHPDIARLLIERGADADVRDNGGRTPLDFACKLSESDPRRQPLLEVFQELAPETWFTKFCESQSRVPG